MKRATVLDELATAAVRRAQDLRSRTDLDSLYQEALLFQKRDFASALSTPGLSVISEIKRASPSAGFIRDADPAEWGARYELEGAGCLSVLTEPERFEGSLEDLDAARNNTTMPVLRKDFTVDEAKILETGTRADAVLLIAALFEAAALARYVSLAVEVGLTPLSATRVAPASLGARRSKVPRSTVKSLRSRLLTPITLAPDSRARFASSSSWISTSGVSPTSTARET